MQATESLMLLLCSAFLGFELFRRPVESARSWTVVGPVFIATASVSAAVLITGMVNPDSSGMAALPGISLDTVLATMACFFGTAAATVGAVFVVFGSSRENNSRKKGGG